MRSDAEGQSQGLHGDQMCQVKHSPLKSVSLIAQWIRALQAISLSSARDFDVAFANRDLNRISRALPVSGGEWICRIHRLDAAPESGVRTQARQPSRPGAPPASPSVAANVQVRWWTRSGERGCSSAPGAVQGVVSASGTPAMFAGGGSSQQRRKTAGKAPASSPRARFVGAGCSRNAADETRRSVSGPRRPATDRRHQSMPSFLSL